MSVIDICVTIDKSKEKLLCYGKNRSRIWNTKILEFKVGKFSALSALSLNSSVKRIPLIFMPFQSILSKWVMNPFIGNRMKYTRQSLGELETQFFAYVQLRRKETIYVGEISPILKISQSQECDLLRRLARSGWIMRLKQGLYLVPQKLPAGGKWRPSEYLILSKLMEASSATYQICGPNAFNFHGFDNQIPNAVYAYNNKISGERKIGGLTFHLIKTDDVRLGGTFSFNTPDGIKAIYSSKARTLLDAVYDWSRFNGIPRGYEWIRNVHKSDRDLAKELVKMTVTFGNQGTIRRIGFLLENIGFSPVLLSRLNKALNRTLSLIPWIPGKIARGRINKRWGLIVNS